MKPEITPQKQAGENFFSDELVVVNVGIRPFFDSLKLVDAKVLQVDWRIPAGGDQEMIKLVDLLLD